MNFEAAAAANQAGLDAFARADPDEAEQLLRKAYRLWASELGILVNLGLALMQQGRAALAERCYQLARQSPDLRVRRSACKNLGFLHLWRGEWQQGWHWHGRRFEGERFLATQWRGEPLNGRPLLVWNDVGMGDAFQFVRYTKPLVERGERVVLAVQTSQVALFRQQLCWPLEAVVDREQVDLEAGPHIPLMSLIGLLDPNTTWGRNWPGPTWRLPEEAERQHLGLCWASNPGDRSLHRYKSLSPEQLLQNCSDAELALPLLSLQTDEPEEHQRLGLVPPQLCWISTLALVGRCQTVHSVDTAVAHLAAGAGAPVRLHLAANADWRWQQLGAQWYPSLQLG